MSFNSYNVYYTLKLKTKHSMYCIKDGKNCSNTFKIVFFKAYSRML